MVRGSPWSIVSARAVVCCYLVLITGADRIFKMFKFKKNTLLVFLYRIEYNYFIGPSLELL